MNSRWLAAKVITHVLQDGQSLTLALENVLKTVESPQDRAFIQAICYGVCRYYHRLDFILAKLVDKPLKAIEVKALILIGLYQLNYMRVKPHAAVSETVQAAKKIVWAKNLINAVLRNFLRKKEQLESQADQDKTATASHPAWLIQYVEQDWPAQADKLLAENNQQPPMVLRINRMKTTRDSYLQLLTEQNISAKAATYCSSGIILDKPVTVDVLPYFAEGWVSIQDSAAQLATSLLDLQSGQRVLDVCAAPGGKTAHILEQETHLSECVAVDIDESRLQRVAENLKRLELSATLKVGDAALVDSWWDGKQFDRILVDAPCSATGVIRRHPDIKLLRRSDDIAVLTALQSNILKAIWPLLATGGLLVYATCSILKQENEEQIQHFLAAHKDAEELPIAEEWGHAGKHGRQILTGESGMDGFYYARLVKH